MQIIHTSVTLTSTVINYLVFMMGVGDKLANYTQGQNTIITFISCKQWFVSRGGEAGVNDLPNEDFLRAVKD